MFKDFFSKLKSRQALAVEALIVVCAFLGSVYGGTRLGANIDHSTTSIHGGHTLVVPGDSLGGFMSGADKTKLDGLGSSMKGYVDAWSTSNIGLLSGLANTTDGVAVNTAGMVVCSAAQTTTTQDGCYLSASGAWTRLSQFAAGSAAHGATFTVISGTSNKGVWAITNATGSDTIGTNDLTAINLAAGGGAVSSVFGRTGAVVATSGDYTSDQVGALNGIDVAAVTTKALSGYTYANGTAGVGATITGTANQACDTIDGLTPSLTPATGSYVHVLVNNGASFVDNGLYDVTQIGNGSTPCILTRDTRMDTITEMRAAHVHITQGLSRRGAVYGYINDPAAVIGTDALAWGREDINRSVNEYASFGSDFTEVMTTTGTCASGGTFPGSLGLLCTATGTGSSITLQATPTATDQGLVVFHAGTTATGTANLQGANAGHIFLTSALYYRFSTRIFGPNALSDGTNTFRIMEGLTDNTTTFANSILVEYTQATSTAWMGAVRNATVLTHADGPTTTINTATRVDQIKYAGETKLHTYFDGVEASGSPLTTLPLSVAMTPVIKIISSANAGVDRLFNLDSVSWTVQWPNGKGP